MLENQITIRIKNFVCQNNRWNKSLYTISIAVVSKKNVNGIDVL